MNKKRAWILDLIMAPIGMMFLYPFFYMVINTIKSYSECAYNPLGLPQKIILTNYIQVFQTVPIVRSFFNTLTLTCFGAVAIVVCGAMAAYPIVFRENRLNKIVMYYLLAGFMIPFQATLIPLFETMRAFRFIDQVYGVVLFYISGCTFSFFLIIGYMKTLPRELEEAAIIDGCSIWGVFWRIIFPLLKPILVTSIIYHVMWIWNDFLVPFLFLNTRSKGTLVLEIFRAKGQFSVDWPSFLTMATIVLIPIVLFFMAAQKQIVKGLAGGAVKG